MKIISQHLLMYKITSFIALLTMPFFGFSQGGNTCANALASPITIPFSTTTGTLCAGTTTDDYNMVGASCMDALNTQGPDWLYYFCAPTTGTINIALTNMTLYCYDPLQVAQFPALSVWQGCPSTGSCVAGTTSQGTPEVGVSANVTAGQCYYIMIDNYPGYCPCFDYSMAVNYITPPPVQPSCTNMGFDAGSFAGWSGTYGYSMHDGPVGASTPTYNPITFTTAAPQHTITAGGTDPIGGFPMVAPGGGPNSMRLGDGVTSGYGGATLEQTFNVTAANALLTYQYAVVIQDANAGASAHTALQQPFFKIEVFDCAGNPIVCGQYLVVGGPGIPGFLLAPGYTDVYYKTWTPVAIDLTPYIGSCAKIKFTVGDCTLGAHFAYAYIDVACNPMAITGPNFICPGTSTTLAAPTGAAGYSWSPGGQTTQSVTVSPAVNTTYTCTITSVAGATCTTLLTYPVTVHPPAVVTSASQTVCAGTAATITATPTVAGGGFSWSPGGQTTAAITVTPAATTTYIATYTDLNGCTDTAHGIVVVNPIPITTVNSVSVCDGATATTLTAAGATTYSWSTGAVTNPISVTPVSTTSYTVTGTSLGCSSTAVATVTVNPIPVTTVNSATICPTQIATLTAAGATTYSWSTGAVINPITVTPIVTTTYTVTGTSLGCSSTAIATVTIGGTIATAVNSPTICAGQTATLTGTGATTYVWDSGATSNPITVTPAVTTTYTVTGTTGGCTGTAIATVTVNPLPVTTVNSPAVCAGLSATLTAAGATTYSWNTGSILNPLSVSPVSTTSYTVTGTSLGCTSSAIATVTINPAPVSSAGADILYCTGSSGTIGAAATVGDTYLWSPASGLSIATASNPVATIANAGPASTSTSYTVTTTNTASGCTSTDVVVVTVDAVQTANAGSPQSLCFGASVTLAGSVGGSATGGTWSGGTGTFSPNATTLNATYTPSTADAAGGSVTLTLTSNSSGSCPFASSNVTLSFYPSPVVNFTANDTSGCPPHCPFFTDLSTVTGGAAIVSWLWGFGDGNTSTLQNPTHCYPSTGSYDVSLSVVSSNGCSSSLTISQFIDVFQQPIAAFSPSPNPSTIFDGNITMNNQSSSDVNYWFWNFGDGDTLAPSTSSPVHTFPTTNPGTYDVTLIVHNADGCYDTVMHPIEIGPEFTFFIPNCVTPNDDGVNDYFFGDGIGIVKYDIWIFDRWGNEIFHGKYLYDKWDGRANEGKDVAQQDVYVWKVKLTDVFDRQHSYIGTVTIVK
jgi:gliding motility-associated-like protein